MQREQWRRAIKAALTGGIFQTFYLETALKHPIKMALFLSRHFSINSYRIWKFQFSHNDLACNNRGNGANSHETGLLYAKRTFVGGLGHDEPQAHFTTSLGVKLTIVSAFFI